MAGLRAVMLTAASLAFAACGIDAVGTLGDVPSVDRPEDRADASTDGTVAPGDEESIDADASDDADGSADDAATDSGLVTLTVTLAGSTAGVTVTSSAGGISCPGTCSGLVPSGTKVNLTAAIPPETSLISWSGGCAGRDPTCGVSIAGDISVTATFGALVQYVHSSTTLYTVNGSTGATSTVATFGGACSGIIVGDLAIDRSGKAYVATLPPASADSTLHVLNLATASCGASLGGMGRRCNALAFAPDPANVTNDVLYAASTDSFYEVDVGNGATSLIGALGTGLASSGDIVWVPGRGVFITLNDAASTDKLGSINLTTGAATVIGTGVGRDGVYSLGQRAGVILGYGNGFSIKIDPTSGAGSTWNASTGVDAFGAASGP